MLSQIRGSSLVPSEDARTILLVLSRIIADASAESREPDEEAVSAFISIVGRVADDEVLQSCADWWLRVYTGSDPATALAFLPSELIDSPVREHMITVITSDLPAPIVASWRLRRSLEQKEAELEDKLNLENQGNVAIRQEHLIWRDLVAPPIRRHLEAARELRLIDEPIPTERELKKMMKEKEVTRGSDVWHRLVRLRAEIVQLTHDLRNAVEKVAGWANIPRLPDPVAEWPTPLDESFRTVERFFLSEMVVADSDAQRGLSTEEAAGAIAAWADGLDNDSLIELATLVDTWPSRDAIRHPSLNQVLAQISDLRRRAAQRRRSGDDVSAFEECLRSKDLEAAEAEIGRLEGARRVEQRGASLSGRLRKLSEYVRRIGRDGEFSAVIAQVEVMLDESQLDAAEGTLQELEAQIRRAVVEAVGAFSDRSSQHFEELRSTRLGTSEPIGEFLRRVAEQLERIDTSSVDLNDLVIWLEAAQRDEERLGETVRLLFDEAIKSLVRTSSELLSRLGSGDSGADDLENLSQEVANIRDVFDLIPKPFSPDEMRDLLVRIEDAQRDIEEVSARVIVPEFDPSVHDESFLLNHLVNFCTAQFAYDRRDIERLYVSLKSKPFVMLTGLAGSGKSTIARLFANAFGATSRKGLFRRIAVRPDWVDQSEVLGFVNPSNNNFQPGWLAEIIRDCGNRPTELFVILLDEMNLAPVEQYFAEYLSAAEEHRSGAPDVQIALYRDGAEINNSSEWPASLRFPENLLVIGTANVDETTRVLSDRVIDRANIIQLTNEINSDHHRPSDVSIPQPLLLPFEEWRRLADCDEPTDQFHDDLVKIGNIMRDSLRIGLGIRSHIEIENYVTQASGIMEPVEALDDAVLQRIIPKLRGYKYDLEDGLNLLRREFSDLELVRSTAVIDEWLREERAPESMLDGISVSVGLVN